MKKYCGWSCYENWNVVLWLNNIEWLYFSVIGILQNSEKALTYKELIYLLGLENENTGDGVSYISSKLNYKELDECMKDMFKIPDTTQL